MTNTKNPQTPFVRRTPSVRRHPYLETLEPYEPPDLAAMAASSGLRVEQLIRLDANENPFGPSPRVARALAEYPDYGFYPDYLPLRQAVARYAGVTPVQVSRARPSSPAPPPSACTASSPR
jgi:histidinol-phosphate/aromatic aminotransferase/cobyric acid decarboxylase-like protein